ncbi:MAG: InlB B-repeat-containing protein, partial [Clostridiales bacterium]|nr:InlB B-repeat-containing protein [Clostridiales bacterium]
MKKHKSRSLALLLAVAMVFQFCIFSSQSAWAGAADVSAAAQTQDVQETPAQEDAEQPAEEQPADVDAPAEEEPAEEVSPGDEGGAPAEEPAAIDGETPAEEPADVDAPADESAQPAEQPAEDAAKEDTENKDMPARTLAGYADGVNVFVTAEEGTFDKDVKMVVKKVGKADTEKALNAADKVIDDTIYTIKAVDITFVNKDGKEVQPAKQVKVDLRSAVQDENATREVVHIQDNGKAEVMDDVEFGTKKAVFEADHFSIYAIVETGTDARVKVIFKGLNDEEIDSMYVKKNDDMDVVLYDPGAGELPDGVYFRGWTTDPDYTPATEAKTIEQVRTEVAAQLPPTTDGKEITYYAMLFKDYRITYLDENNISLGQEEVTFRADATSDEQPYTVNMAYTVQNDTHHFEGWNVKEGSSNIVNYETDKAYQNKETITITGDVTFSVNAPEGHWFIFDENGKGATYTAPQFIHKNKTPTPPNENNMIRNGYTFGGWYADKATADQTSGGDEYDFNQTLTDKTTVYARWIPNTTAPYTIIIWKQNLDADGYDFEKAITVENATVGSNINVVTGTSGDQNARINGTNYGWKGFHYSSNDQAGKKVATEGNTVVNVYYDRNEYTLTFVDDSSQASITYRRGNNNQTRTANIGNQDTDSNHVSAYES